MIDPLATALASSPPTDLLRLVAVPVFGWAAYRDIRTRRVPNRTWLPLALLGVALLGWEVWRATSAGVVDGIVVDVARQELFFLRIALSLGMVGSIGYLFYWLGGFGGADAKALIVLAVLFPTFPQYLFPGFSLPLTRTTVGVFSLTVLTNTVFVGALYPVAVTLRNALSGHVSPVMFLGKPVPSAKVVEAYGSLMQTPEGTTRSGLDLDALRMYLQWRGCSLAELRSDPDRFRDPDSLPADPNPPGDGSIPVEGAADASGPTETDTPDEDAATDGAGTGAPPDADDPWGAEAFLDDIEGSAYGTTPETLREGLDVLVDEEVVWVSPGMPFIVPMFAGLLVSLVYGDLFVAVVGAVV